MTDDEAAEVVADARRIPFPAAAVVEDLERIDNLDNTNEAYREIIGRLARANYKHFKAALNFRSRVR